MRGTSGDWAVSGHLRFDAVESYLALLYHMEEKSQGEDIDFSTIWYIITSNTAGDIAALRVLPCRVILRVAQSAIRKGGITMVGKPGGAVESARSWNYLDVLELVVACLGGNKFKADKGAWERGILAVRDKYRELLPDVRFTKREPFPPFSREVNEFIRIMDKSRSQSKPNPVYEVVEVSEEAKDDIKAHAHPELKRQLNVICEMSAVLLPYVSYVSPEK